jgi:tripartite-type tricarboxylate transporter receptor subunit TctC
MMVLSRPLPLWVSPALRCSVISLIVVMVFSNQANAQLHSTSCQEVLDGRTVGMIVPNQAGGGYDTYGRAVAKHLGEIIGMRIPVTNVPSGGGLLAMNQVAGQTADEILLYADGVEEVLSTTDATDLLQFGSDAFEILGIVYTEPEAWLAQAGLDLRQPSLTELVFSTSSIESNFVPLVIAAKALGFSFQVVAGYGGSGEAIAAVLRGETDLTTASLTSTLRGATNGDLELVMVVSDHPSSKAANVPPMFGPGSIFEARSASWTDAERKEREALVQIVLTLGTTRRAIFTASSVDAEILTCLRAVLDTVLVSEAFVAGLEAQGRSVEPVLSVTAQEIFSRMRNAFEQHASEVSSLRQEFESK